MDCRCYTGQGWPFFESDNQKISKNKIKKLKKKLKKKTKRLRSDKLIRKLSGWSCVMGYRSGRAFAVLQLTLHWAPSRPPPPSSRRPRGGGEGGEGGEIFPPFSPPEWLTSPPPMAFFPTPLQGRTNPTSNLSHPLLLLLIRVLIGMIILPSVFVNDATFLNLVSSKRKNKLCW